MHEPQTFDVVGTVATFGLWGPTKQGLYIALSGLARIPPLLDKSDIVPYLLLVLGTNGDWNVRVKVLTFMINDAN